MYKALIFFFSIAFLHGLSAQNILQKNFGVVLVAQNGEYQDSLVSMSTDYSPKLYKVEGKSILIDKLGSIFTVSQIDSHNKELVVKHTVTLQTRGCLSSQDLDTFRIKVKKEKICWKFRRKGKKYKGAFLLKEIEEQQTLNLPHNVCNKNPFSGY